MSKNKRTPVLYTNRCPKCVAEGQSGGFIHDNFRLCQWHLLSEYDLNARYPEGDIDGMFPHYDEALVVIALRIAREEMTPEEAVKERKRYGYR